MSVQKEFNFELGRVSYLHKVSVTNQWHDFLNTSHMYSICISQHPIRKMSSSTLEERFSCKEFVVKLRNQTETVRPLTISHSRKLQWTMGWRDKDRKGVPTGEAGSLQRSPGLWYVCLEASESRRKHSCCSQSNLRPSGKKVLDFSFSCLVSCQ